MFYVVLVGLWAGIVTLLVLDYVLPWWRRR